MLKLVCLILLGCQRNQEAGTPLVVCPLLLLWDCGSEMGEHQWHFICEVVKRVDSTELV